MPSGRPGFFLGDARQAQGIARAWDVRYVAWCTGSFGELGAGMTAPPRLAGLLARGTPPAWLVPVVRSPSLVAYRIEPGLFDRATSR
jgi:hypothetical protein